jgi:Zn-dependent protease
MTQRGVPFTQSAMQALGHAERLADQLRHASLAPEHILLGFLRLPDCQASVILETLHVDTARLRQTLEESIRGWPASPADRLASADLSREVKAVFTDASLEAQQRRLPAIDTRLLLLGLLRTPRLPVGDLLRRQNVTESAVQSLAQFLPAEAPALRPGEPLAPSQPVEIPPLAAPRSPFAVSPVFALIVFVTAAAAFLAYAELFSPRLAVFLFVTGGWIVSLCLHEFGHAATAFWGGDVSVANKGYLTLNPLKYTHGLLSIVFPILFMLMGGIGLPGGAVYINKAAIIGRERRSLVSAAGPIATGLCAVVLLVPFALGLASRTEHAAFWAGLAMLAYLEITALVLNLLPIPGLDGFGIVEPYLPPSILRGAYLISGYTFFLLFFLFASDNPFSQGFRAVLRFAVSAARLDPFLIGLGFALFRFWAE